MLLYEKSIVIISLLTFLAIGGCSKSDESNNAYKKNENIETTISALKKGADTEKIFNTALDYFEGKGGVKKNRVKARSLYEEAANQGYIPAIINLALMYDLGEGIEINKNKAFEWYLKAANQGYAKAQFNVGNMYYTGTGTEKSIEKALSWYKKSANQGHEKAIHNVTILEKRKYPIANEDICSQHPLYITYIFGYEEEKHQKHELISSEQNMLLECTYSLNDQPTPSVIQIGCYLGWEHSSRKRGKMTCDEVISYFKNKGINVNY